MTLLFARSEKNNGRIAEEIIPIVPVRATCLGRRQLHRMPADFRETRLLQGPFVGRSIEMIILDVESLAVAEERVTDRGPLSDLALGALHKSVLSSSVKLRHMLSRVVIHRQKPAPGLEAAADGAAHGQDSLRGARIVQQIRGYNQVETSRHFYVLGVADCVRHAQRVLPYRRSPRVRSSCSKDPRPRRARRPNALTVECSDPRRKPGRGRFFPTHPPVSRKGCAARCDSARVPAWNVCTARRCRYIASANSDWGDLSGPLSFRKTQFSLTRKVAAP